MSQRNAHTDVSPYSTSVASFTLYSAEYQHVSVGKKHPHWIYLHLVDTERQTLESDVNPVQILVIGSIAEAMRWKPWSLEWANLKLNTNFRSWPTSYCSATSSRCWEGQSLLHCSTIIGKPCRSKTDRSWYFTTSSVRSRQHLLTSNLAPGSNWLHLQTVENYHRTQAHSRSS